MAKTRSKLWLCRICGHEIHSSKQPKGIRLRLHLKQELFDVDHECYFVHIVKHHNNRVPRSSNKYSIGEEFVFGDKHLSEKLELTGFRGMIIEFYYTLNGDFKNDGIRVKVLSGPKIGKMYRFNNHSPF